MRISVIAAVANNGVIGKGGELPWHLSADLKRFKEITMGKPIIMGRNTYASIGKALPGRTNIVVTRDPDFTADGCTVVHSFEQALEAADGAEEAVVIGGAAMYRAALERANRFYLTTIEGAFSGDTYFPEWQEKDWIEREREQGSVDERNPHPSLFRILDRR